MRTLKGRIQEPDSTRTQLRGDFRREKSLGGSKMRSNMRRNDRYHLQFTMKVERKNRKKKKWSDRRYALLCLSDSVAVLTIKSIIYLHLLCFSCEPWRKPHVIIRSLKNIDGLIVWHSEDNRTLFPDSHLFFFCFLATAGFDPSAEQTAKISYSK